MSEGKKSNFQPVYAIIRIVACFSVVFHHMIPPAASEMANTEQIVLTIMDNILMCNNGLFFMLSGKFALENYRGGIVSYYKKKFVQIFLPAIVVSVIYYLYFCLDHVADFQIGDFISALAACEIIPYLWFVYALFGFYLVVPFLAPMVKALNEKEEKIFMILLMVLVFFRNMCQIFHISYLFASFPFFQLTYMFLGYLVERVIKGRRARIIICITALFMTVVSCLESVYAPGVNETIYSLCLSRMLMCMGVYLFICDFLSKLGDKCSRQISFLSGFTYYIYLVHIFAQELWSALCERRNLYGMIPSAIGMTIIGAIVVFVVALFMAMLIKTFEKVLQKSVLANKWNEFKAKS